MMDLGCSSFYFQRVITLHNDTNITSVTAGRFFPWPHVILIGFPSEASLVFHGK
ncbi:hypothetical protein M413DRAFT_449089 [Hebeloma cylindrosporum]|uniref:Uncharacterized protein n=1 Tax=Hebeloma cylindrosporum TaxID=76867 RepID=A0A0C2XF23_HEBCY|nr:hypothetical protein M413DRAFT_449089 [Hebeloma cylindrosporum h7]